MFFQLQDTEVDANEHEHANTADDKETKGNRLPKRKVGILQIQAQEELALFEPYVKWRQLGSIVLASPYPVVPNDVALSLQYGECQR